MPIIFDVLYREFCRARLAEMRKQLLLWPGTPVVPEENCEAGHPDDAAVRGKGLGPRRNGIVTRKEVILKLRELQLKVGSFPPACHLRNVFSMSELGQKLKSSTGAYVFRSAPNNGHRAATAA